MAAKTNALGLTRNEYKGRTSTLCPGCGHASIMNQIISMAYDLNLEQHNIIKMSGIGCSSKTPAYFLGRSHGFNAVHGRMPSVSTGAVVANRNLKAIGVSGDGDTGSIGMGQFKHAIRRNVPMVYIIENNGVYGLTKGQFSATADEGQVLKYYGKNEMQPLDLAMEAIITGGTFVARSFSGDSKQVQELLRAAIVHKGTAVLDIVSPCVTFNNRPDSSKSYPYGKANEIPLHEIHMVTPDYVASRDEITVDQYRAGEIIEVKMHDGTHIQLKKLGNNYDPRNRWQAIEVLERAVHQQMFMTGLIYYEPPRRTLIDTEELVATPLSQLTNDQLRPSKEALDEMIEKLR
jgi:2-oxoglutarate/2-oxoacid ferredoxin oxidoreductase subunit beta